MGKSKDRVSIRIFKLGGEGNKLRVSRHNLLEEYVLLFEYRPFGIVESPPEYIQTCNKDRKKAFKELRHKIKLKLDPKYAEVFYKLNPAVVVTAEGLKKAFNFLQNQPMGGITYRKSFGPKYE